MDLIAAPHSLEVSFSPEILQGICNELSLYYDQVILDVPCHYFAIKALSSSVDTVLMVCVPEPLCVRACHRLSITLEEMGIKDMRLVINNVPKLEKDRRRLKVSDLDQVMDQVALPLGAVFPRCKEMEAFACDGTPLPEKSAAEKIFHALAERLMGKSVPLILR